MSEFEFERGREAGVKWGERLEQERILAIIKDNILPIGDIDKVVALIKGETK
jgi:hypothetical protein